jgi:hypothetical protein
MGTDEAKTIYKARAATAECVNAQARNRGMLRMPVRGLSKMKSVVGLFVLAHNLLRMAVLAPELIGGHSVRSTRRGRMRGIERPEMAANAPSLRLHPPRTHPGGTNRAQCWRRHTSPGRKTKNSQALRERGEVIDLPLENIGSRGQPATTDSHRL